MKKNQFFYLYIGLIGIAAFVLMLWITPYGSGVSPDSTIYIGGAKSLLSGKGFSIRGNPITHFPPLYPLFLAATGLLEINLVQAARFLNAILFGINVGLVALAVYLSTRHNFLTTTFAILFFISSAPLLVLHSMAWSEPLFITFSLACIILLSMYIVRPTLSLLIASSLSLGFAILTRYIGISFLPAALVIVFVGTGGQHFGQRFRNTFIWSMLSCTPFGILLVRNTIIARLATDRSFAFHPVPLSHYVKQLIVTVFDFITPISLPVGARLAIVGLLASFLVALLVILFKQHVRDINWRSMDVVMTMSCLLFSVVYLLFLFISISFFDAATPVDTRLLLPIFVTLIVGAFSSIWNVSQMLKKPMVWWCFILFVAVSISIKTPEAIHSMADIQKNGSGYTSRQWQDSESIAFIKLIGRDVKIYTNGADVLDFLTGKQSQSIPAKMSSGTRDVNPRYIEEVDVMCKDITENRAMLVYFNRITRWYLPTQTELESTCHIPVLRDFADGTVYGEKYR